MPKLAKVHAAAAWWVWCFGASICACAVRPRHEHSLVGEARLLAALEHIRDEGRRPRPLRR
jgi:hypothetical protein